MIVVPLLVVGCQIGPRAIKSSFPQYSEAIRQTEDEQMLLNLVRLRYNVMPVFLQISSISTSFGIRADVGASATLTETRNGVITPDVFGLNGSVGYDERPTITFSMPESREFLGRMLAPVGADQLAVLSQSGWGTNRVWGIGIKRINRLENLDVAEQRQPQTFEQYREAIRLIDSLRNEGLINFGYGFKSMPTSPAVPEISSRGIAEAQAAFGGEFVAVENDQFMLYTFKKILFMHFSPGSDDASDAQRLRELLDLDPSVYSFAIVDASMSNVEKKRLFGLSGVSAGIDPDVVWDELGLSNRSMMEILFFASTGVDVPDKHVEAGIVDEPEHGIPSERFTVLSSKSMPRNAAVRVPYRGYWFYIAEDDLESERTFLLLNALFAVTGGRVTGANPILTIPVGG
jgi:hypothetical protein